MWASSARRQVRQRLGASRKQQGRRRRHQQGPRPGRGVAGDSVEFRRVRAQQHEERRCRRQRLVRQGWGSQQEPRPRASRRNVPGLNGQLLRGDVIVTGDIQLVNADCRGLRCHRYRQDGAGDGDGPRARGRPRLQRKAYDRSASWAFRVLATSGGHRDGQAGEVSGNRQPIALLGKVFWVIASSAQSRSATS